jgi:hypothetical protein
LNRLISPRLDRGTGVRSSPHRGAGRWLADRQGRDVTGLEGQPLLSSDTIRRLAASLVAVDRLSDVTVTDASAAATSYLITKSRAWPGGHTALFAETCMVNL